MTEERDSSALYIVSRPLMFASHSKMLLDDVSTVGRYTRLSEGQPGQGLLLLGGGHGMMEIGLLGHMRMTLRPSGKARCQSLVQFVVFGNSQVKASLSFGRGPFRNSLARDSRPCEAELILRRTRCNFEK